MKDLIAFVKTRVPKGALEQFIHDTDAFVAAERVLCWLHRQERLGHNRELELNPIYAWCQRVPTLLAVDALLSHIFEIENNRLQFRSTIPEQERAEVRKMALAEYQPEVRI